MQFGHTFLREPSKKEIAIILELIFGKGFKVVNEKIFYSNHSGVWHYEAILRPNNQKPTMEIRKELQGMHQLLIEAMADFLDTDGVIIEEGYYEMQDPVKRKETELHIRMANAAMREYEKTVFEKNAESDCVNFKKEKAVICDSCVSSSDIGDSMGN